MHHRPAVAGEDSASFSLTDDEKRYLLVLAREAITQTVAGSPAAPRDRQSIADSHPELEDVVAGVFVSLHIGEALRGCIGYLEGLQPLPAAVQDTARAAAMRDPRFDPVREDELKDIDIEVSVLMPMVQISGPEEISIGKDGVLVRCGRQQGVLLPQVAIRAELDAKPFLEHTCLKAGLPKDAWTLPQTEVFCFKAEVFSEKSDGKQERNIL